MTLWSRDQKITASVLGDTSREWPVSVFGRRHTPLGFCTGTRMNILMWVMYNAQVCICFILIIIPFFVAKPALEVFTQADFKHKIVLVMLFSLLDVKICWIFSSFKPYAVPLMWIDHVIDKRQMVEILGQALVPVFNLVTEKQLFWGQSTSTIPSLLDSRISTFVFHDSSLCG